jgi:O-antigen biosynthesis protein WbqV
MIRLPLVCHDLLVAAAAIVATFYVRFENEPLASRLDQLPFWLPFFVAFASVVYFFFFRMHEAKWRFTSLPELWTIAYASLVLAVSLLVIDYVLLSPYLFGTFLFRQDHHRALLAPADGLSRRAADRLPLFPVSAEPDAGPQS